MAPDPCHLFHTVDEETLMKEPLHILHETSPLFEILLQGIHRDGLSLANIPLYNSQIMRYQFLSFSGDWGLAVLDIRHLGEELSED